MPITALPASSAPCRFLFFRYFFGVLPLVAFYLAERRRLKTSEGGRNRLDSLRRDRWLMGLLGLPGIALFSIGLTFAAIAAASLGLGWMRRDELRQEFRLKWHILSKR